MKKCEVANLTKPASQKEELLREKSAQPTIPFGKITSGFYGSFEINEFKDE